MLRLRKKYPILTATMCQDMEMARTSLEVLFGERVSFVCLDFNTCHGKVLIGSKEIELVFIRDRDDLLSLRIEDIWYTALFEEPTLVKVASTRGMCPIRKTVAGDLPMRWAGRSNTDRWEEPVFLPEAEHCARVRGLTLDELLNSGQ